MTDTFGFRFNGSFQHIRMDTFGKYDTLRWTAGCIIQLAGQFGFITHQFAQVNTVSIPVFNFSAGHSAFHSSFCHCAGNFGDEAWIYRFRDKVFRAEREVVHVVCRINYIGYRLFCQISDSVYGCNLHLFVDSFSVSIQSTAEDIRETDYIINLVRIVGTSGSHQYVRTCCHGIFVRDFRCRVSQCEHNRHRSHAAHHILA